MTGPMLQTLQKLFASNKTEPEPLNGKVTLGDVLRRDWFDLWYQPKIDLRAKRLVGNFPQAFSHLALVNSAYNLTSTRKPVQHRAQDEHAPPEEATAAAD